MNNDISPQQMEDGNGSTVNEEEVESTEEGSSTVIENNTSSHSYFDNDAQEVEHFDKIVDTFYYYKIHSLAKLKRELLSFKRLSNHHQSLIPGYVEHLKRLRQCVNANYVLIKTVVKDVDQMFENRSHNNYHDDEPHRRRHMAASDFNMEKLQSTLRQFARDWSVEGVQGTVHREK